MFKQFRYPTNRNALMIAIASAIVLITMAASWLVVSTDTALLNRKLHLYDDRQEQILQETRDLWRQIGVVTSSQEMERRMREAGFTQPQSVEFMVPQVVTTAISSTVSVGGGVR